MEEKINVLKNYLESVGETAFTFARKSKISTSTVYQIWNGSRPQLRIAKKICFHSRGKIKLEDFGYQPKEKN